MPYWMVNPDHGVMPVYDLSEVERVKQWGWSLLNEGHAPEFPGEAVGAPESEPVKRKPGRPVKVK